MKKIMSMNRLKIVIELAFIIQFISCIIWGLFFGMSLPSGNNIAKYNTNVFIHFIGTWIGYIILFTILFSFVLIIVVLVLDLCKKPIINKFIMYFQFYILFYYALLIYYLSVIERIDGYDGNLIFHILFYICVAFVPIVTSILCIVYLRKLRSDNLFKNTSDINTGLTNKSGMIGIFILIVVVFLLFLFI